ncbi:MULTISPECIES: flagellar basal body rod protein FlgB [Aliagarivorans]|uniref:flagellar basal body rod protein FlgB n=1 Tax=Aliagarivorans TaxID=882379 RepID=UPI000407982D|nr:MULTISPECIES: flagellar basal body rod protein FlgB [Aliagarivorans]
MAISFDKALGVHQHTIGVRARRSEVLASNIANADTPHYKAQDIDFKKAMAQAKSGQQAFRLATTHEGHLTAGKMRPLDQGYRVPDQPDTGDGNTVDMQQEKAMFMQNGLEYQAGITFLNSKFSGLQKSIKGQ